jgi:hypothetical protein
VGYKDPENKVARLAARRKHNLQWRYGLTLAQVQELFTSQGSRCGACGSTDPGRKTLHWPIDHCHETGKIRGALCNRCNLTLGMVKDNPAILRLLADYLERQIK